MQWHVQFLANHVHTFVRIVYWATGPLGKYQVGSFGRIDKYLIVAIFAKVRKLFIVFNTLSSGECRSVGKGVGEQEGNCLPPLFGKILLTLFKFLPPQLSEATYVPESVLITMHSFPCSSYQTFNLPQHR